MMKKKKMSGKEKSLRKKLSIIISTIFVLPSLILCYIIYEQNISFSFYNSILFFLILTLAGFGILLIYYVFNAISNFAKLFKRAVEGGDRLLLNIHQETAELNDISLNIKGLLDQLASTTEMLNQAREAFHKNEETYRSIFENIAEGYYEVDLEGNFTFFNTPVSQILGYSAEELKGMNYRRYTAEENANRAFLAYSEVLQTGIAKKSLEGKLVRKDGSKIYVEASISLIKDSSGQPAGFRGIIHDITERKNKEAEMLTLSVTDPLTGLYNRRGFKPLVEQQLKIAERTGKGISFLYADLDGLKQINDRLGHKAGDEAIVEAANILKEVFRKMDVIARVGGDEFAVLATETSSGYSDIIRHRLKKQIDIHNTAENRTYKISFSIGLVSGNPGTNHSLDDLMSKADELMYKEKQSRRVST